MSENSETQNQSTDPVNLMDTFNKYLSNHFLMVLWSLVLLGGGFFFLIYYAHINYVPEITARAAAPLLIASSITGLSLVVIFLLLLFMPGTIWSRLIKNDEDLSDLMSNSGDLVLWHLPPFITFLLGIYLYFIGKQSIGTSISALAPTLTIVFLCFTSLPFHKIIKFLLGWFLSTILLLLPLAILSATGLEAEYHSASFGYTPLFLPVLALAFINYIIINPTEMSETSRNYTIGFVVLLMTLLSFNSMHVLPAGLMKIFGFGNISGVNMVVNQEGLDTLKKLQISEKNNQEQGAFGPLTILSKLGGQYYISYTNKSSGNVHKFTLREEQIVSWSQTEVPQATPSEDEEEEEEEEESDDDDDDDDDEDDE
jgi:hypothetical protein